MHINEWNNKGNETTETMITPAQIDRPLTSHIETGSKHIDNRYTETWRNPLLTSNSVEDNLRESH